MCSSKDIHTPPMEGFCFAPPPPKKFQFSFSRYFAFKILAFQIPFPLGISNDLPWSGYGFFLFFWNYTINFK